MNWLVASCLSARVVVPLSAAAQHCLAQTILVPETFWSIGHETNGLTNVSADPTHTHLPNNLPQATWTAASPIFALLSIYYKAVDSGLQASLSTNCKDQVVAYSLFILVPSSPMKAPWPPNSIPQPPNTFPMKRYCTKCKPSPCSLPF